VVKPRQDSGRTDQPFWRSEMPPKEVILSRKPNRFGLDFA